MQKHRNSNQEKPALTTEMLSQTVPYEEYQRFQIPEV